MRPLTSLERAHLEAALDRFRKGLLAALERETAADVWAQEENGRAQLFLVARALSAELAGLAPDRAPASAGLPLGHLDGDRLVLGLEGAYEVGRRGGSIPVKLKDKAAGLFLYGRDVLGQGLLKFDRRLRKGQVVPVGNARGEVLGVAQVLQSPPGKGPVLRPVADLGWYLRGGG